MQLRRQSEDPISKSAASSELIVFPIGRTPDHLAYKPVHPSAFSLRSGAGFHPAAQASNPAAVQSDLLARTGWPGDTRKFPTGSSGREISGTVVTHLILVATQMGRLGRAG
jgi:hypothetical protein